ncbi:S-adenosyl-L-methionine-dependent methyltransferase [Triangularia verruculosa]|uniref:S-adenosyl-L-methionine-dependent methyltransferase n=1 Tax=Triangularia verruculosa TaxID=2587418 RepID=A0AAN7AX78_9PEZI|nr:S-adenosyl-L-methionine-dependent methyltransferase [Triangularia verruculosa]
MPHQEEEQTFRSYGKEEGEHYAKRRPDYHPSVYQAIINHHTYTGGKLDTLLDVGCGPGSHAIRALAPQFQHAIGIDPGEGMIEAAKTLLSTEPILTKTSESIQFKVGSAEHLEEIVPNDGVDLLTASHAAHWFDMPVFWRSAANVLRSGGSVAIWASGEIRINPNIPAGRAIQQTIDVFWDRYFKEFIVPGNEMIKHSYVDLLLPWTLPEPIEEFEKDTFYRREWSPSESFFDVENSEVDLDRWEKMMGTGTPVTRWREAHPEDAGTERDPLRMCRREIEKLLHEAGVEKGKETVKGYTKGVLLMIKRK